MTSTSDGGKKARSPGRPRRKPLKPSAQGRPVAPVNLWWTYSCAFHFCTRGYGCIGHPGFPCALLLFEGTVNRTRPAPRGEKAQSCLRRARMHFLRCTIAFRPPLLTGNGLWAGFSVLVRPSVRKDLGDAPHARFRRARGRTHA